jgi:LPXTG-motif cell wall-anchored protein
MRIFSSVFFLLSLAGSAWATPLGVPVPGPEIDAGILGMTLAAGAVYLIKRRKRS